MLQIDTDKISFIITKTREFETHVVPIEFDHGDDLSREHADPLADPVDPGEREDDATYDELVSWINAINHDDQCQIVALAWIGRGDYSSDEWDEVLTTARQQHNNRTAEYLLGMPLLADYLEEGLSQFGQSYDG